MKHDPVFSMPPIGETGPAPASMLSPDELIHLATALDGLAALATDLAGFADPVTAARRLQEWDAGVPDAMHDVAERRALAAILPQLVSNFEYLPDPDAALATFDEIICRLPDGISLFGALQARPSLRQSLIGLIGHAPALSRYLIAQPDLIGRMLDSSAYAPLPPVVHVEAELRAALAGEDLSSSATRLADIVNSYRFGLSLQTMEGAADPMALAGDMAQLAETALQVLADAVIARFEEAHGRIDGGELVILGLGRFGGGALTHRSDLDLIYLFTGDHRAQSDGRRPLDANEYFSRIAQQITRAMTTATTLGPLYAIDTRLRPWGAKGLLACSTACFDDYHAEEAWTWEHMALTRGRPVYGSVAARAEVTAILDDRLYQHRDPKALLADATKMRVDMARHKPPRGLYDVKLISGGLVDLEFTVHVSQLAHHVGLQPQLRAALGALTRAKLLDPDLIAAHDLLGRMLVTLQLLSPQGQTPLIETRAMIAHACGHADWETLDADYTEARLVVRRAWQRLIG